MAAEEYGALSAELAEPEELAAEVVLAYDGLSPTAKVEETEAGAKITVVDKHGTTTATVKNGKDGATGAPGAHIGPEAPTNGEKLWVDTDEAPEESETEGGTQIDVVAKAGQLLSVAEVDADGKPTKWQAVDLPKAETPDWNANEGEKGYIEGRTHYVDAKGIVHKLDNKFIDAEWMATSREYIDPNVFIAEQKLTSGMWQKRQQDIQPGLVYDVHINDVVYPCEAFTEDGGVCIGNNTSLNKNNIPFCIYWAGGSATAGFFYKKSTLAYPIYMKVTGHSWTEYNKLPEEFLPDGVVKSVNGNKPDEKGNVTVEIPESTGGGVDVTASVGQTIIVEEVDASGKPTKWRAADYPLTVNEIIPQTTYTAVYNSSFGCYMMNFANDTKLKAGQKYTVLFDGVEYSCTAKTGTISNMALTFIGNDVLFGNNTGEPFAIASVAGNDGYIVMMGFDGNEHTVRLSDMKVADCYVSNNQYMYEVNLADLGKGENSSGETYYVAQPNEIPVALLKAACEDKPIYLKVKYTFNNKPTSVKIPAVFSFPMLDVLMASGYFDAYEDVIPSSVVAAFLPTLYARGLDNTTSIGCEYRIQFNGGGD